MADQKLCDICNQVIANKLYVMSLTEMTPPKPKSKLIEFITLERAINIMRNRREDFERHTEHYEFCEGCKKVFNYLLTMRAEDLTLLKNEVNGILKLPYKKEGETDVEV